MVNIKSLRKDNPNLLATEITTRNVRVHALHLDRCEDKSAVSNKMAGAAWRAEATPASVQVIGVITAVDASAILVSESPLPPVSARFPSAAKQ